MRKSREPYFTLSAVFLSIAGGRWAAWVGFPEYKIFLIDILLFIGLLGALRFGVAIKDTVIIFLLSIFILFQLLRSTEFDLITRLRDLAPFLYLIIFIFLRKQINNTPRQLIFSYLRGASLFSVCWNLGRNLHLLQEFQIPGIAGVPIFSERSDQFGFVAAIGIITWSEKKFTKKFRRINRDVIVSLFLLEVVLLPGRAGAIAASLGIFAIFLSKDRFAQGNKKLAIYILSAAVIFVFLGNIASAILPEYSSLKRSGLIPGSEISRSSGQGTASARLIAQKRVLIWVDENNFQLLGAGAGREIVLDSGAYRWLSGSVDVRQPHNWWISLYSRYGLLGLFFWFLVFILYFGPIRGFKSNPQRNMILISILVTATFGVIMEAPFGLIPFYFFLMLRSEQKIS